VLPREGNELVHRREVELARGRLDDRPRQCNLRRQHVALREHGGAKIRFGGELRGLYGRSEEAAVPRRDRGEAAGGSGARAAAKQRRGTRRERSAEQSTPPHAIGTPIHVLMITRRDVWAWSSSIMSERLPHRRHAPPDALTRGPIRRFHRSVFTFVSLEPGARRQRYA